MGGEFSERARSLSSMHEVLVGGGFSERARSLSSMNEELVGGETSMVLAMLAGPDVSRAGCHPGRMSAGPDVSRAGCQPGRQPGQRPAPRERRQPKRSSCRPRRRRSVEDGRRAARCAAAPRACLLARADSKCRDLQLGSDSDDYLRVTAAGRWRGYSAVSESGRMAVRPGASVPSRPGVAVWQPAAARGDSTTLQGAVREE